MDINDPITPFSFTATNNLQANITDYQGRWVILYFYPKDATAGCTTQGQNFRDQYDSFTKHNAVVFGVSRESLKSHENFKSKQAFPFELISDPNETLCELFDVMQMKSMYGKSYRGIERSTFVISPEGILVKEWRKVSVPGHVDAVLEFIAKSSENLLCK